MFHCLRLTRSVNGVPRFHVAAAAICAAMALAAAVSGAAAQPRQASTANAVFGGMEYRYVGPSRAGRVTAVEGHRDHPHTFYQGATGGGVWKTTNYGMAWENISDGYFATPSIGHIEVADSDPDIVYVGTGSDGLRSNVIIGKGIYRSDDAGETWRHIGLENTGQIGSVKAHPHNPELVYVAAIGNPFRKNDERGVYRSADGGANWERVLFTSDSVGAVDLEFHPTNPDVIYAGMWRAERKPWTIISGDAEENGIWKTEDGGDTWRRITAGLPGGLTGKTDFAVSPADPDRVYALLEAPEPLEGLYRSDDVGESWTLVNNDPRRRLMHRPFYFTNITASPHNADVVYVNNLALLKSEDGGMTFPRFLPTPHGDNHDLWINPDNPMVMVQGNDGGASVSLDGGQTWSPVNNQGTAELYQVDVDTNDPYWLYAGQQDDGYTVAVPSDQPTVSAPGGPDAYWRSPGGCETGPAVPKPGDPDIVYANCKGRFTVYNQRTGQEQHYYVGGVNLYGTNPANLPYRFQRVVPIEVSPHNPDVVYHGSQYVHRTTDGGRTWERISGDLTAFPPERQMVSGGPITRDATGEEHYSTLYVIEVSPHSPDVIWTGANDGPVHVSVDGGATWRDVTPPMPPEGRMNSIDISRHDPDKVYVAGYRYLLGDFAPYVYRTSDGGQTWTLLTDGSNGVPDDYPVRVVREDPGRSGLLYAGTDFGMFISFNDGADWEPFQLNLPVTPITDIEVYRGDIALSTMGRGFWVMDDVFRFHEVDSDGMPVADVHVFDPGEQRRTRTFRNGGFDWRGSSGVVYEGGGVLIDYWLSPSLPAGEATLQVLDQSGTMLREFTARDQTPSDEGGQAGAMWRFQRVGGGRGFSAAPGAHRMRWDMRADGGALGQMAARALLPPATYTLRLTAAGMTSEAEVDLVIDPRVAAEGITEADLQEQYEFNLVVAATRTLAAETAAGVAALLDEVEAATNGTSGGSGTDLLESLRALDASLNDAGGSYPQPMLLSQLSYLAGMTSRADQAPGGEAYARHEDLRRETEEARKRLAELRERWEAEGGL